MSSRVRVATSLLVLTGAAALSPASAPAAGCSSSLCIPLTGSWQGASPQGLTTLDSLYGKGSGRITIAVAYRKSGKKLKSKYGNSVDDARTNVRYTCKSDTNPWVESGVWTPSPGRIGSDGKARIVVPASGNSGVHTWTFKFKRDTVSGQIAGSYKSSEGEICKVSTPFRAKLKR